MWALFMLKVWVAMQIHEDYRWHHPLAAFHGTPLSVALQLIAGQTPLKQQGNPEDQRSRIINKIKDDEAYVANLNTSILYALAQIWQRANTEKSEKGHSVRFAKY